MQLKSVFISGIRIAVKCTVGRNLIHPLIQSQSRHELIIHDIRKIVNGINTMENLQLSFMPIRLCYAIAYCRL